MELEIDLEIEEERAEAYREIAREFCSDGGFLFGDLTPNK